MTTSFHLSQAARLARRRGAFLLARSLQSAAAGNVELAAMQRALAEQLGVQARELEDALARWP